MPTVTNSFNLTTIGVTIVAVLGIFFTVAAFFVPRFFKLVKDVLKEVLDLRAWMKQYQQDLLTAQTAQIQSITDAQTTRIENCIHKMPGHPEGPKNSS